MYSYKSQYPIYFLPSRIRLSSGLTRTTNYTEEEIVDAGYIQVNDPPTPNIFQKLVWTGESWLLQEKTEEEKQAVIENQWAVVREERNSLLQKLDWVSIKNLEQNEPVPENILAYRQALRDITLQSDPFNIVWPQEPK